MSDKVSIEHGTRRPAPIGPNLDDGPYEWAYYYGSDVPYIQQVDWLPGQGPRVIPLQPWENP